MRIVDQNKEFSIEFEGAVVGVEGRAVTADIGNRIYSLGAYADKERAKEVFLDIHESYEMKGAIFANIDVDEACMNELKKMKIMSGITIKDITKEEKVEFIGNSVYYMPES